MLTSKEEATTRRIANHLVDIAEDMEDIVHELVDVARIAEATSEYSPLLPPLEDFQRGCKAQALGLRTVSTWLILIGRRGGIRYHNVGVEHLDTLDALEKASGFDLGHMDTLR